MTRINLGLDLGGTALRVAFAPPGQPARFAQLAETEWPWLLCAPNEDRATVEYLPATFRSAKTALGTAPITSVDGHRVDTTELITAGLRAIRSGVERDADAKIGKTVISVPARFLSRQRTALLAAAKAAGLTDVQLISDSIAAVVAHTGGERGGTVLAFGMGYGGVEVGLVRALRGHCRALEYDGAAGPAGRTLDEQMLATLVRELRQSRQPVDPTDWDESTWRRLRLYAQRMKERLAGGMPAEFPASLPSENGTVRLRAIRPEHFESALRGPLARTVDLAHGMLSRAGLVPSDVDTVLLFGGSTRIPLVSTMVAGLGGTVHAAPPEYLAHGALLSADMIGGGKLGSAEDHLASAADGTDNSDSPAPPLATEEFTAPDMPATVWPHPTQPDPLARARQLAAEGNRPEAITLLQNLLTQTTALLAELETPVAPTRIEQRSVADVLVRANALLAQGQYEAAVRASHGAWEEEPRRPDVFEAMLEIHIRCAAAMSDNALDDLSAACSWLLCACSHDQGNPLLRGLLANREYHYGRELLRLGRDSEALTALETSTDLDPDHTQARELLTKLRKTARKRNP